MPRSAPVKKRPQTLEETWLADLIHKSAKEIFIIDDRSLLLLDVSDAACDNLQYRADELATMHAHEVLPDLSGKRLERAIAKLRAGNEVEVLVPATMRRRDGTTTDVRLRLSLLQLPGISTLIAVVEAAGETSQREAHVISREERLAQIEGHVPGLLFQLRLGPTGLLQFSFLSQACQDLLGQPSEVLYANPARFFAQIVEEDREDWTEKMRESAATHGVLNWEGRIHIEAWRDTKWINVRATPRDEGDDGILWTGLMTNITMSKRQAEEIRQSRAQLAELSAYAENVREQERTRIERDLHDDLGGNLSALKMMLGHVWRQLPSTPFIEERSAYLNQLIDRSIESIHRISADLRPGILDAGLVAALEWLAQEQQQQTGIPYLLHSTQQDIDMPPMLATSLFRIAQEACNNIRKHAHATQVDIHLHVSDGELVLEVIDNGIGIPDERRNNPRSFGLLGMSERMASLGGSFHLASRSGKGTMVRVKVPMLDQ